MRRVSQLLIAMVIALAGCAMAQVDVHTSVGPAQELFRSSAWAHGYMHGYEWGYHHGGIDLHLARGWRDLEKLKEFKQANAQYNAEFGDRDSFTKGYRSGFEVGYGDGFSGQEFRALEEARTLALSSGWSGGGRRDRQLDVAMDNGYRQGRTAGLHDGRAKSNYRPEDAKCPSTLQQACPAYDVGFRWGYADGYNNQAKPEDLRRQARK